MQQIFFFHLPKAGGTSLKGAIERALPRARVCPVFANDIGEHRRLAGDYAAYRGYDVYCGHYGRDVYDSVVQHHQCTTNFRHPVTRLVSLYNYFRYVVPLQELQIGEPALQPIKFARQASFHEFVASADPAVEVYVRNAHYRQLSNSNWSLDETSSVAEVSRFIDSMPGYYVCEFPDLSRLWLQTALGIADIAVDNVTQGESLVKSDALDRSIVNLICEKNALDLALYRHAVERLLRLTFER